MKVKWLSWSLLLLTAFIVPPKKKIKVWLIGDSTMSIKEVRAYPETGWGMPFAYFFDSTVTVDNRAKNGRSTKSFRQEGLWQPVMEAMKEGDYVFIQFGHNDEVITKATYTTETEFKNNLTKYVSEARSRKAIPILITPVARRKFDSTGKIVGTHDVYSGIVRSVALANKVPLIDLDQKSQALLQQFGPETSKWLFNHLEPNEHPNYPEGKQDDTHFSELGARKMAELVLAEMKNLKLELAERIVQPIKK
ncbi:MAG: rhamnogalacturonan acetylesterase [Bacteroidota bacterium]|nr:rhamnogalacturonan acetylesterase [Flavisolibacter sp.]MBD0296059.1 rhamnogalacturonan acetylesterase [Flavisolibacter sp.]MBD0367200.1 rhamnogalacturonan acetylesterase [Flavisolibacter sp.]MBD0374875.1 rhamnogalacturonan acetylesterase [Flavisolibacter sp.]MDQ3845304.1 rhamnogalacturonan acetylesterase [Bacteroidota bacterium]